MKNMKIIYTRIQAVDAQTKEKEKGQMKYKMYKNTKKIENSDELR